MKSTGMAAIAAMVLLLPALGDQDPKPARDAQPADAVEFWYVIEAPDSETKEVAQIGSGSLKYTPDPAEGTWEVTGDFEMKVRGLAIFASDPRSATTQKETQDYEIQLRQSETLNADMKTTGVTAAFESVLAMKQVKGDVRGGTWVTTVTTVDQPAATQRTDGLPPLNAFVESVLFGLARKKQLVSGKEFNPVMMEFDEHSNPITGSAKLTVGDKEKVDSPLGAGEKIDVWSVQLEVSNLAKGLSLTRDYKITEEGYVHEVVMGDVRLTRVKDMAAARGSKAWTKKGRRDIFEKSFAVVPGAGETYEGLDQPKNAKEAAAAEKKLLDDAQKAYKKFSDLMAAINPPNLSQKFAVYDPLKQLIDDGYKLKGLSGDGRKKLDSFKRNMETQLTPGPLALLDAMDVRQEIDRVLIQKKDSKEAMEVFKKMQAILQRPALKGTPEYAQVEGLIADTKRAIGSLELNKFLVGIEVAGIVYHWDRQREVVAIDLDLFGMPVRVRHPVELVRPRAVALITGLPPREGMGNYEAMKEGDFLEGLPMKVEPIQLKSIKTNEVVFASGSVETALPFPPAKKEKSSGGKKPGR